MRFLVITLILVAVAQAKNFQKREDFFDIDTTKNSDSTDTNYDQSIPDFNIQPKKSSDDQFSNDGDYLEEADEDYNKPLRLAAPVVRKAKKPLQVEKLRNAAVEYINFHRRLHAASPLILHGPLTVGAQKWCNSLVKAGKVAYDKATTHNQTISVIQEQQDDAVRDSVVSWDAKKMNYDWANKKVNKDNKDFVILVNRKTTHVGVGISRGPLGKVYTCAFYSPRVNEKTLIEDILPETDVFAAAPGAKCQKGFDEFQGTCYKFHTDKKNWMGAVVECSKENAVLSDVSSKKVEAFLKTKTTKATTKQIWDGLNDRITEGLYSYVSGSPVSHLNWKTGEPQGKNQNCVALEFKSAYGTMMDIKCTDSLNYICKKPLEGYVLYQVTFEMPNLNFQKAFSDQASTIRQKLNEKIQAAFKVMYKGSEKTFKKAYIIKISDGSPPPKAATKTKVADAPAAAPEAPAAPAATSYYNPYDHTMGKKRDDISPTATAMPSSSMPSPTVSSSDSFDDNFLDSFDDKSKKSAAKPKTKTQVVAVFKFGIQNIKADPTLPFQAYLNKNKGKSAAPLGQAVKFLSVKLLPPGSEPIAQQLCAPSCATTCNSACSPTCCFQQPSYSSYQAPCGATYNPCAPPAAPPAPKPQKPKVMYAMPQPRPQFHVPRFQAPPKPPKVKAPKAAPCVPAPANPCTTTAYQYGAAPSYQPAYSTYGPPPMAPPVAAPCTPTAYQSCQSLAAPYGIPPLPQNALSIQGHMLGKRSIKGAGSATPCGVPPLSPCGSPMGIPMMPQPMMPPMQAAPCGAPPFTPCAPPMPPPMLPPMLPPAAPCGPPLNPCAPPVPPPMPPPMLPPAAPCGPPLNPCAPPMPPPMLPPAAPCGPPMNPCAPPMMPPPMPYGPMPYGPMPYGPPCTPAAPCVKPKAGKKGKKAKKGKKGKKTKPFRRCGPPPMAACGFGFAPPMPMSFAPPMPFAPAPCGAPPMSPCAPPMPPPMLPPAAPCGAPPFNPCAPPMLPPAAPCGLPPFNPCAPPMPPPAAPCGLPPMNPCAPPMPMPFAAPCAPFSPCAPPKKAAKKPAPKKPIKAPVPVAVAAPGPPQPIIIQGIASPSSSAIMLPPAPAPYIAPPPMVQFVGGNPCYPSPLGNPCGKRAPILRRPKKGKNKKPVTKTITPIQANQQAYGGIDYTQYNVQPPLQSMPFNPYGSSYGSAIPSPLGSPLIPGMTYPKCLHNPTNPCKPLKFKTPKFKPVKIKLKSTPIEIQVPQNPNLASLMNFSLANQCQPVCTAQPICPPSCSKRCCLLRGKRHE